MEECEEHERRMRWAFMKPLDDNGRKIALSGLYAKAGREQVEIRFGKSNRTAQIVRERFGEEDGLYMSKPLIADLGIDTSLRYQIRMEGDRIVIGPVIGILLGRQCTYYTSRNMSEQTHALHEYEKTGGLFYAFTPEGIDYCRKRIYGLSFGNDGIWRYGNFPYPDVIFRRGFSGNEKDVEKIRCEVCDLIFNGKRQSKWEVYEQLRQDPKVCPFLPDTAKLSDEESVSTFLENYGRIILKPANLSRGRGIYILESNHPDEIEVTDCQRKESKIEIIKKTELAAFLKEGGFYRNPYIVQNRIALAKVNKNPFDIRLVMHKTSKEEWKCSGMECRIAGDDRMISNIARGGKALFVSRTLQLAFGPKSPSTRMKKSMVELSEKICSCLEQSGERYAEFGLDLAIDQNQRLWFIEANVRPSFKGFRQMNHQNYLYICSRPMLYAVHLAGFESGGKQETDTV